MGAYLLAEVGSVHDGSIGNACQLVHLAHSVGATAIKFQIHSPDETLIDAPNPAHFQVEARHRYFARTSFNESEWMRIRLLCQEVGIDFVASPFSSQSLGLLCRLNPAYIKIASGEVTNIPLLEEVLDSGFPVLLSSGMSNWQELDQAVEILSPSISAVMQCTSQYPTPLQMVGLNVLSEIKARYRRAVGFSDHSEGIIAPVLAVAYGASFIEKHLTFSNWMYGSDARYALEPSAFGEMVKAIRAAEEIMGNPVSKDDIDIFSQTKHVYEKKIIAAEDIPRGTRIERQHVLAKKASTGLPISELPSTIGRKTCRSLSKDSPIVAADLQ